MTDRELAGRALLPCPWCGSAPLVLDYSWAGVHGVACNNDACPATMEMTGPTEAEAIAAWNRRTPSSEGDGRDGERLDWLCAVDPARRVEGGMGFRAYEDVAPLDVEHSHWVALTDRFYGTAREAIDAAREKERGDG